ncbi:Ig-like domain-containing protein [Pontibacillus sp. HMF3514]|uniref:Ig-like domain-containing protein n=1 Tax=Pontibacillus sp. HMF3514 TaxID=2692425 RepID=UPI00131FBE32|nr:Ig-like domain-containing protein [Pontibacillus sp. HMF3514]QHE53706.1 hypothetical protein GS400_17525 [Pontibacillus sp. HMF3514]
MLLFLVLASHVSAESNWDQTGVPANKEWNVQFNTMISSGSVNNETVYVTNEDGKKLSSIQLETKFDKVIVSNNKAYELGKTYQLHITKGVQSIWGKFISKEVVMEFVVQENAPTSGASGSSSKDNQDEELSEIINKYEVKFTNLEDKTEDQFNQLVEQAKDDIASGATFDELESKYLQEFEELEVITDETFNYIYTNLVNELKDNGYSSSYAERFKNEYEESKQDIKNDYI